ncbi:zinc finger CCCH domain-containing protein 30-like isoform X2 [Impatiens glandulifera]|nr:zinc finger CCCH domain-containing protein 30-like isoform X2 [Impatiens glandulifera]
MENDKCEKDMDHLLNANQDNIFASLLELAADNDFEAFKHLIEQDASVAVNKIGPWYSRRKGSKQISLEHRTPLMIAATYGSLDVVRLILSVPNIDVNLSCGLDRTTALHCAASGGSTNALDVVKLLVSSGADPTSIDASGLRPFDVIVAPPKNPESRTALEEILSNNVSDSSLGNYFGLSVATSTTLSSSPRNGSPGSPSDSVLLSPTALKLSEKKEYPIDPSLPDIKYGIYSTDEFRMYSFKIRPCSRAYSHDWTECPFVHPGENARRRDPRKFHYSCVPCPDFRKGACKRGDMCEYAHGVFECWLHPAQYRTRLCKDGTGCARRVCFFAHKPDELRPLYLSTGSGVSSPRSNAASASPMDMAVALGLLPGSPSSMMSFNQQPMSPTGVGNGFPWPQQQQNVPPPLNLAGSNLQSSRLRSSFSARDILPEEMNMFPELEGQMMNDLSCLSRESRPRPGLNHMGLSKMLSPSNLDELFSAEMSSPRYSDQQSVFSPSHRSAALAQFQQQQQNMLSPINTNNNNGFSPKNIVDHPSLYQSYAVSSPRSMTSPRSMDPISPMGSRLSAFAQRENQQQQQIRSPGSNNNNNNMLMSKWGSPSGKVDWSLTEADLGRMQRMPSSKNDEPDLSWVQTLVKESPPPEMKEKVVAVVPNSGGTVTSSSGGEGSLKSTNNNNNSTNNQNESIDHSVLGAWLEQMQLDQQQQLVA